MPGTHAPILEEARRLAWTSNDLGALDVTPQRLGVRVRLPDMVATPARDLPLLAPSANALLTGARALLYAGLFASSLLSVRLSGTVTMGDAMLGTSAFLLALLDPAMAGLRVHAATWLAVGLVILGVSLSSLRADSVSGNIFVGGRLIYLVAVLLWQMRRLVETEQRILRAAYAWALGAALSGLGTVVQYYGGSQFIPGASVTTAGRYTGFAQHVSDAGGITGAAAAFFLAALVGPGTARQRLLSLLGLFGCVFGIVLSGSVSSMVAVAAAAFYLLLRGNFRLGRLIVAVAGIGVVFTLASNLQKSTSNALNPIERVRQVFGDSASVAQETGLDTTASRIETDRLGLDGFRHHPIIGRGLDPSSSIVNVYGNLSVHNLIIGALHGGGIFLAIGLLIPICRALRVGLRLGRHHQVGSQIFSAYLAALVFAMTAPSSFNRYFWIPLLLVIAYGEIETAGSDRYFRSEMARGIDGY